MPHPVYKTEVTTVNMKKIMSVVRCAIKCGPYLIYNLNNFSKLFIAAAKASQLCEFNTVTFETIQMNFYILPVN